jgi:hypothetical protein
VTPYARTCIHKSGIGCFALGFGDDARSSTGLCFWPKITILGRYESKAAMSAVEQRRQWHHGDSARARTIPSSEFMIRYRLFSILNRRGRASGSRIYVNDDRIGTFVMLTEMHDASLANDERLKKHQRDCVSTNDNMRSGIRYRY